MGVSTTSWVFYCFSTGQFGRRLQRFHGIVNDNGNCNVAMLQFDGYKKFE